MSNDFHKPTRFPNERFEEFQGDDDPAELSRIAHESAWALLARVRKNHDPEIFARLTIFVEENNTDAVAQLWARASAHTLPGALWRIYLLQLLIRQDPESATYFFSRGVEHASTIDPIVAGAPDAATPDDIIHFADQVLRGIFVGDFAAALERAAAFCRLSADGAVQVANDTDVVAPRRASDLTIRALRFAQIASDLVSCARLWRRDALD